MTGEDVLAFIKDGEIKGIRNGMPINYVIEKLGQPDDIIGDVNAGYLMFGSVRVGYLKDVVNELAILFEGKDIAYKTDAGELYDSIQVSGHTQIHEFIALLNSRKILWDCYDKSNLDYFIIRSEIKVAIVFDLYDGSLFMISCLQDAI
jgi:hypothetical protein